MTNKGTEPQATTALLNRTRRVFDSNLNSADFIMLHTDVTKTISSFLVDTQSDISLIKASALVDGVPIDHGDTISIKGVTEEIIYSMGTIEIILFIQNVSISQKLHVVPNHFQIPSSGILGKDFLKKHMCKIDYEKMSLTLKNENEKLQVKILQGPDSETVVIPPHSEAYRQCFYL